MEQNQDKVVKVTEELGQANLILKDGKHIPVATKTIYTHYESGRKDCTVMVERPLEEIK